MRKERAQKWRKKQERGKRTEGEEKGMDILKVAVLGVVGTMLALVLKREKNEYSTYISITVCICIFIYLMTKLETVLRFITQLEDAIPVDGRYIGLLLKMTGIAYVAEFAANICRDAGFGTMGSQIEIFAKMSILVVSIPVLSVFLETIEKLVA